MKLKNIESCLKGSSVISTFDVNGVQWIGSGRAFFPLPEEMTFSPEALALILNLDTKKQEVATRTAANFPFDFSDSFTGEEQPGRRFFNIETPDGVFEPIDTSDGLIFVPVDCFKPFAKDKDKQYDVLIRRDKNGWPYVAVKEGMFLAGVIVARCVFDDKFYTDFAEEFAALEKRMSVNAAKIEEEL